MHVILWHKYIQTILFQYLTFIWCHFHIYIEGTRVDGRLDIEHGLTMALGSLKCPLEIAAFTQERNHNTFC